MVGCARRRLLLLWHAAELARGQGADRGEVLRLAVRSLEPPEDPAVQVGGARVLAQVHVY